MQFDVDDEFLYAGSPTTFVQIEIEYFDQGTDTFNIQYDAIPGGANGDGKFMDTGFNHQDRHRGIFNKSVQTE